MRCGIALAVKSRAVSDAFGVVSFFMADEDRTVRVDVARDVLARVGDPPPNSKATYVERLLRNRRLFAQIAAAKYDEGQYSPEVKVLVVRITADDLI
jgi:hypothetical protein